METKTEKDKERKRKTEETRIVPPLGNPDEDPPTRDEKPGEEFIEQKSNRSKDKS